MIRYLPLITLLLIACNGRTGRQPSERHAAQEDKTFKASKPRGERPESSLVFAFYNVENLYDTDNDPRTEDDDFTPSGKSRWTPERLERKLENLARGVTAMDGDRGPDVLGLCEVENRYVLEMLVSEHLPRGEYRIVHTDSRDGRGIDVALLYRASAVTFLSSSAHGVDLGESERPTRDILEVRFLCNGRPFTVLVNHWPSRLGGEAQSAWKRERAAARAARVIDSLEQIDRDADIVLMGDLNDTPFDASIRKVLDADAYSDKTPFPHRMINTAMPVARQGAIGSYYYRGSWEVIDQIMLSRGALDTIGLFLHQTSQTIFAPDFLRDRRADPVDRPPYRTFKGPTQYLGGTSDHFPIVLVVGAR